MAKAADPHVLRSARALIEANAHEASDLIGELASLLDRIGNDSAYVAAARMVTVAIALAGNRMDISVRTPELVPQCWFFDRELAGMVLSNALHSALTHATRSVLLELRLRDGQLGFCIADDGGGFPQALVAETTHGVERGEINGNALGIHFARLVAGTHTHGGRCGSVELSNRVDGPGTRFALWLP
jgi:hypothetical protein